MIVRSPKPQSTVVSRSAGGGGGGGGGVGSSSSPGGGVSSGGSSSSSSYGSSKSESITQLAAWKVVAASAEALAGPLPTLWSFIRTLTRTTSVQTL